MNISKACITKAHRSLASKHIFHFLTTAVMVKPCNCEIKVEAVTEKKVNPHSMSTVQSWSVNFNFWNDK